MLLYILCLLLMPLSVQAQDTETFVNRQLQRYPQMRLLDLYKSCFQDFMGAEHLVSDREGVKHYLDTELEQTSVGESCSMLLSVQPTGSVLLSENGRGNGARWLPRLTR